MIVEINKKNKFKDTIPNTRGMKYFITQFFHSPRSRSSQQVIQKILVSNKASNNNILVIFNHLLDS